MGSVIKVNDVSMMFNLSSEKIDSIKEYFIKAVRRELHFQEFWALRDISCTLEKGDSLGIVGLNGSGKSTLLKIVSGILKPTKGTVETYGSIAPLIELGAGFDANLSARENIYLNGAILGYSRAYMSERFDEIIEFAELQDFVDIIDEILAVGDYKFQEKSFARMQEMIASGATVVFVSHSIEQVQKICKKALWLEHGHMRMLGDADAVCGEYMRA